MFAAREPSIGYQSAGSRDLDSSSAVADEETHGYSSDEQGSDVSDEIAITDYRRKHTGRCIPICTAKCCCHICYVIQFMLYIVVFPLWCKYLVTAPMPYEYWNGDFPAFPLVKPLDRTDIAVRAKVNPQIVISKVPTMESACNYSCSKELYGYETDEMNFPLSLQLNNPDLVKEHAHTLFPVILTSGDFKHWMLAADSRNAQPNPFFRARSSETGEGYEMVTDSCTQKPKSSFGTEATYVLACITWQPSSLTALKAITVIANTSGLAELCDSVGGVCGWPCGTFLESDRLPACSAQGIIDVESMSDAYVPEAEFGGHVSIEACQSQDPKEECQTSTTKFQQWGCHNCITDVVEGDEEDKADSDGADEDGGDEAGGDSPIGDPLAGIEGAGDVAAPPEARRLRQGGRRLQESAEDEDTREVYKSLPRMNVKLTEAQVPTGIDLLTTPRVFMLVASKLEGPWQKLYMEPDPTDPDAPSPPVPLLGRDPKTIKADLVLVLEDPDIKHSMQISNLNELKIEPTSCYGRRGPLYVVACAINETTYTDTAKFKRFKPGQKIAPPPFNDRCLAVAGRCGQACMHDQTPMQYCDANGYILQKHLVGEIKIQDNKTLPVYLFVYVLIFGFCVKVVMLCPGIFSPYPHYGRYEPHLTQAIKYIVTCTPTTAGDENKATTVRNLVGCISAMPRRLQCRYHVVMLDETHRLEMGVTFQRLGEVVDAIPSGGPDSYQDMITDFFGAWCEDTKKLDLNKIGVKAKVLDPSVMERVCGKGAYKKLRKESAWARLDAQSVGRLEKALDAFEADLARDNTWTRQDMHKDDVMDWAPREKRCMLRMHYIARAKPIEDERTNRVQHVAPGTWYYKVPVKSATNDKWLEMRKGAREMVYGREDEDNEHHIVPLRTSRGKAGGLNFVENYMVVVAEREENQYAGGDDNPQNSAPCLFSIADARHQFQHDFMASTIPYFFDPSGSLNLKVAFTQCPQHFHESQDKTDYLDTNNASFFRLNCMIRNCSGGVSSCGTNGTWMICHKSPSTIWEHQRGRVRDRETKSKILEIVERRTFHESCKVEDTASSLQAVVQGRHSQFINRKLSYGMAKAAVGYLAATQRWAEGGVVLSLQTLTSFREQGHWMVFVTLLFFAAFVASLLRLINIDDANAEWVVVKLGLLSSETMELLLTPLQKSVHWLVAHMYEAKLLGTGIKDPQVYTFMAMQFVMWLLMLVLCMFLLWCVTSFCKIFRRRCCTFPDQLRWCGRLLITMDNLTYFVWFWTAFFWIGFNYYTAVTRSHYHFQFEGMMLFMGVVNILNWGMIISNAFRYSLSQSMEANEVAHLSMDNIWRSNQLFYMTAPVQLFSIVVGFKEFLRWQFYGIDISFWEGGDRGDTATSIVKYWTLMLVIGPFVCWTCYAIFAHEYMNAWAACVVVSIIGMDVLHPCAYLWVGDSKLTHDEARKMSWKQALTSSAWWKRKIYNAVLNDTLTGILKYVGPAYFLLLPAMCLSQTYFGVNGAFMMVAQTQQR